MIGKGHSCSALTIGALVAPLIVVPEIAPLMLSRTAGHCLNTPLSTGGPGV